MDTLRLVNVTPHELVVLRPDKTEAFRLPPSGTVARVAVVREQVGSIAPGGKGSLSLLVPKYRSTFGALENMPEPTPLVVYVASLLCAQAAKAAGRNDVFSPGELTRDAAGLPIGCIGLTLP